MNGMMTHPERLMIEGQVHREKMLQRAEAHRHIRQNSQEKPIMVRLTRSYVGYALSVLAAVGSTLIPR